MYAALAAGRDAAIEWSRVWCFWGDERMVPPDDPRSNFGAASRALLGRPPASAAHLIRIRGESPSAEEAAVEYERDIAGAFQLRPGDCPRFDLILLGLGADGHTASLFPGDPALEEQSRIAIPVHRDAPEIDRVTLTLRVINNARRVIFLVSGPDKAGALARVRADDGRSSSSLPAARVKPTKGEVIWLVK